MQKISGRLITCAFILGMVVAAFSCAAFAESVDEDYAAEDTNGGGDIVQEDKCVDTLLLDNIIQDAIRNNPEILAAGQRWEAARKGVKRAMSLDDPVLRLGKVNAPGNPFNIGKEAVDGARIMSPVTIAISQKVPFPGKLKLRGRVAAEAADMKGAALEDKVLEITAEVKLAYYDLFLNHKAVAINEENRDLLHNFTSIAEAMYSVGKVSQRDVLAAMVELSKAANEIAVLRQERKAIESRLNNLLNRPVEARLGRPGDFDKHTLLFDLDELDDVAIANRPILAKSGHAVERDKLNLALAKKDYFSDFTAMIEYRRIDNRPTDTWSSALSINIPWLWSKQRQKVKEAKDELRAAIADRDAINNQTLYEVRNLVSSLIAAESTVGLFKTGVIPQAQQSLDAARVGYETGSMDFLTLIDSQRTLLNAKLQYYTSLAEYEQNIARLERIVGLALIKEYD